MVVGITARPADPGAGRGPTDSDLVRVIQSRAKGDLKRDSACEALIARYQNMISSVVRRYSQIPELTEELTQVGYVGLLKAINNFNPAIGDNLAAYAHPCISGEIKRYFRDKRWQVRVRRPVQELRLEIRNAAAELTQQLARDPSASEIAAHLHLTEHDIRVAQQAGQAFQATSLDTPLQEDRDDGGTLSDLLGADDPELERSLDMQAVWTHFDELPDREQRLLMMRFYGNMTQSQIGARLGISQMHVSRLLTHALTYLRDRIADNGETFAGASPAPA